MYEGTADQNLRAEARAVEEGHRAWLNDDGSISVVSHNTPGVRYIVQFWAVMERVLFECNCLAGQHQKICKHTALAARRLEREGLAHWSGGHWLTTAKVDALMGATKVKAQEHPVDPMEGLS